MWTLACSSVATSRPRLGDGSDVPVGSQYSPPVALDEMPRDLLGKIGASGVRGEFRADLVVGTTGTVVEVRIVQSLGARLDELLMTELKRLSFSPATLNGAPVAGLYAVRYDFTSR